MKISPKRNSAPVSQARTAAFEILLRVEREHAYASELLHSALLDALSPSDRGLAMELTMGVLRWRSRLDEAIARFVTRPLHKLDIEVLTALRIGAYQALYLERVPPHAIVSQSVELVRRARKTSAAPVVNAVLRKMTGATAAAPPPDNAIDYSALARRYAHPEWMVQRWTDEYGREIAAKICEWDQRVPETHIRLPRNADTVEAELTEEGVRLAPGRIMTGARRVTSGDITRTRAFSEGRVWIQDEGSQLVAALVGSGRRILDCCAAPGGKSAAIADRNPTAKVVAAELHPHRARTMRKLVRAQNVQVIAADATALPFADEFDRVLADVPCSGTGTLARNPEIKWRLSPADLGDLHKRQVAILTSAIERLVPGGRLVYSSCSLEPEENEAVVDEVLRTPGMQLIDVSSELARLQEEGELAVDDVSTLVRGKYLRTLPGLHECDGFFAAVIERQR